MADFLGKALGSEGVADKIGKQAGHAVEVGVKKVMSGAKAHDGKKKKEAGGPAGGPAGPAGGPGGPAGPAGEAGGAGGFNVADALNFGSGNKEGGEGGGLDKIVGGLFK